VSRELIHKPSKDKKSTSPAYYISVRLKEAENQWVGDGSNTSIRFIWEETLCRGGSNQSQNSNAACRLGVDIKEVSGGEVFPGQEIGKLEEMSSLLWVLGEGKSLSLP
jgi:hypothetical protein